MEFRQVHLDFHTCDEIKGVGSKFSKENFQNALKEGHISQITVFAKCHHGWAYFPSETNIMNPALDFDLLGSQIEAAHEIGVKTPVYLSAGIDEKVARVHPEWLMREKDETMCWTPDFTRPGFHRICFNTPYLNVLKTQVEEVVQKYDCDEIFLDIVGVYPCYCQSCVRARLAKGQDPYNPDAAYQMACETYLNYTKEMRASVDKYKPGLPIFHNAGHLECGRRDFAYSNSHLELESLPTGGWGYDHFPLSAAYARTLGLDFSGMTGKFHGTWGDFGGFKHPNALRYEAALSVANGAKVSVGDQMHPLGFMDNGTYKLIGEAFKEIEEKEPWLDDVKAVTDVAILSQEGLFHYMHPTSAPKGKNAYQGDIGAGRILLEGKYLFNMIDTEADFCDYKVIIVPDDGEIDDKLTEKLKDFTSKGGKVLATGKSCVNVNTNDFSIDLGAKYIGECKYAPAYIKPDFEMEGLFDTTYVVYTPSYEVEAKGTVLTDRVNSYFNRTTFHFCSHGQTPYNPDDTHPAITYGKDGIYVSFPLFTEYALKGSLISKRIITHMLDLLLDDKKTICVDMPSQGVVTLMDQQKENRMINHLLFATPIKRGQKTEVIEDIIPLYNISVKIRTDKNVKRVYKAPSHEDVKYEFKDNVLSYTLDHLECHQMIVIDY